MRRFGEPVRPDRTYRTRPGAYGVILDGGDVLVTEQAEPVRELQLPGGGIDPGESALRALHRECLEETGWRIRAIRRLGAFQRFAYMPEYDLWARKVCHIYLCRAVLRAGDPAEPGHRALWMPLESAIRGVANDGDRAFLKAVAR
jgi:8-oxo-dGTP diphosphatase